MSALIKTYGNPGIEKIEAVLGKMNGKDTIITESDNNNVLTWAYEKHKNIITIDDDVECYGEAAEMQADSRRMDTCSCVYIIGHDSSGRSEALVRRAYAANKNVYFK